MVVLVVILVMGTAFYTFFHDSLFLYLNLQTDATNATELTAESQRLANVIRGLTDITSASANDMQIYAYFAPSDTYVSQLHYYLNNNQTELLADVTQMTANPPTGVPIPSTLQTFVIIDNFKQSANTDLFTYLDSSNNPLTEPIADLKAIKAVRINLAVATSSNGNQAMTLQVSLRNRKTNL